ncbi:MAG: MoaD/ThiS family protein [Actinomycetes bacterium]
MKVKVVLFGPQARLLPPGTRGNAASFDVEEGTTLAGLLDAVGVPAEGRSYVQLNGTRQELAAQVNDGDEVRVIVPLGGG